MPRDTFTAPGTCFCYRCGNQEGRSTGAGDFNKFVVRTYSGNSLCDACVEIVRPEFERVGVPPIKRSTCKRCNGSGTVAMPYYGKGGARDLCACAVSS